MTDRFSLASLRRAYDRGVRLRAKAKSSATSTLSIKGGEDEAGEEVDLTARRILLLVPLSVALAAFSICILFDARPNTAEPMLAALGLLAGSLIGGVGLIASWRDKIEHPRADTVPQKALEEAIVHVLVGVLLSVLGAAVCIGLIWVPAPVADYSPNWTLWKLPLPAVIHLVLYAGGQGMLAGIAIRVGLNLWIVVNLLWDAYFRMYRIHE